MSKREMKETELQDVVTNTGNSLLGAAPLNDSKRAKRPAREKIKMLNMTGGNSRPGYMRRWVHDKRTASATGSNIEDKKILGYTIVENEAVNSDRDFGTKMGSVVEKFESDGSRMVLMEIPIDEYEELQTERRAMREAKLAPARGTGIYANGELTVKNSSQF